MRRLTLVVVAAALVIGGAGVASANGGNGRMRMTLVGASIGQQWNFDRLHERVKVDGAQFGYVGLPAFDKSKAISELATSTDKPDVVLIKECATYFPGDTEVYHRRIDEWVMQLRTAGIQAVLVTTAPVGKPKEYVALGRIAVKRLIGRPTWLDSVTRFNDWVTAYGRRQRVPVFDLEAVLRRNRGERWLRDEYDSGDHVHLTEPAYHALDLAFAQFLSQMENTWPA